MCADSWQLFEMAEGTPIAVYSEQSQEHWNKNITKYKSGCSVRAGQHSVKINLRDIMARMLQVTHPVVVAKHRQLKCTICGQIGHTVRSHNSTNHLLLGEDDTLINDIYQ